MNKLGQLLKSRTFITLVVMFAFNALQVFSPSLSPEVRDTINGILVLIAGYYKVNPSQQYNGSTQTPQA
jgi:hypothetical protein